MRFSYTKNNFDVSFIKWEHIIQKIDFDFSNNSVKILSDNNFSPTILCESDYLPIELDLIKKQVEKEYKIHNYDLYTSLSKKSITHGRHKDNVNVIIIQLLGSVSYLFDCGTEYCLNPGDSIYISREIYHTPLVWSARSTLSFAVKL